jgi:predicted outer membrane repeat protein
LKTKNRLHRVLSVLVLLTFVLSAIQPPTASAQEPQQDETGDIERDYNAETGRVSMISGTDDLPITILSAMDAGMTDEQRVDALVQSFAPEFGVTDPVSNLEIAEQDQPSADRITTKYQQTYNGVPVIAGELIVNSSEQGALYSMNGEVAQDLALDTIPSITSEAAIAIARQGMVKWYEGEAADYNSTDAELWIFDESLLRPSIRPAELVWRIEMIPTDESRAIRELVLVNAKDGNIPLHFNQIDAAWHEAHANSGINQPPQQEEFTPTPAATEVPPTETLEPTNTAEPTVTSQPTNTANPTETVEPTADPFQPTPTPLVYPTEEVNDLSAQAGPYYVDIVNGNDSNTCTSALSPCQHIQEAINKASSTDTVYVSSGTYKFSSNGSPNVAIINKSLTLSGGWDSSFATQSGASTIDGEYPAAGVGNNGILVITGTVIVENFIIQNSNSGNGGGIYVVDGNFTLRNSTLRANRAPSNGAGIFLANGADSLTVINSTISGNTAVSSGGGIYSDSTSSMPGTITIQNSTIAFNTAVNGGGVYRNNGTFNISNTIIASNTGTNSAPNCSGTIASVNYSIINSTTGCTISTGSDNQFVAAQLNSTLIGTMKVHPPLSGSPAIDTGDSGSCPATDQKGTPRPQGSGCDIGSVEYITPSGGTLIINNGNDQATGVNTAFVTPLAVYAQDINGNPVSGLTITFTAPASGASGTFTGTGTNTTTANTNASGIATAPTFTSNNTLDAFTVAASAAGFSSADFQMAISAGRYVSPSGSDASNCSSDLVPCLTITKAIQSATAGQTIFVAQGTYSGTGSHVVFINQAITLSGGWNASFNTQSGYSIIDGEKARIGIFINASGAQVVISNFVIQNGSGAEGAGIRNNNASLTINNSTIKNNEAAQSGGGIYSNSTLAINNVTISNNTAGSFPIFSYYGAGIFQDAGSLTIQNSTIANNTIYSVSGGGIYDDTSGIITVRNSILSGNSGGSDCQGTINVSDHNIIGNLSGCTLASSTNDQVNLNPLIPSVIYEYLLPLLPGSPAIDAGSSCLATDQRNLARPQGAGCDIGSYERPSTIDPVASLIVINGSGQQAKVLTTFGNTFSVLAIDPDGDPVQNSTITFTAPGSGASGTFADTSNNTTTASTNVYGLATASVYTANGSAGDYILEATSGAAQAAPFQLQNYNLTPTSISIQSGASQFTPQGSAFFWPMTLLVKDQFSNPMQGITVTFTAPGSGASGTFMDSGTNQSTAVTDIDGLATAPIFTANSTPGSFVLSASVAGISGTADLALTIGPARYVSPSGTDTGACISSVTACKTIQYAIDQSASGDTLFVAEGNYTSNHATDVFHVTKNMVLSGGWNATFSSQTGYSTIDGQYIRRGITIGNYMVFLERFEIFNAYLANSNGGGVSSSGTLAVASSRIHNNRSGMSQDGGGIYSSGSLHVKDTSIFGNTSRHGAGIYSTSDLQITNSALYWNNGGWTGSTSNTMGGGVYISGTGKSIRIVNSTFHENASTSSGSGLYLSGNSTVTVNNSTFASNGSTGMAKSSSSSGTITIRNTLIVNNVSDCSGTIISQGNNVVGNISGCTITSTTGDQFNSAVSGTFIPSVGYYIPSTGSISINAGNPTTCALDDQRHLARPQGTSCDIGAYESPTSIGSAAQILTTYGNDQLALPGAQLSSPLQVLVLDADGSPVSGASVTFTAPSNGPSGTFNTSGTNNKTSLTSASGQASSGSFTLDDSFGGFLISATVTGAGQDAIFDVNRNIIHVSPSGPGPDCYSPATACSSVSQALPKADPFGFSGLILIQGGTYTTPAININQNVTISGGWDATFTSQTSETILDGNNANRILTIGGVIVTLEELIFRHGSSSQGGAIFTSATLTVRDSVFSENKATNFGGAIYQPNGTLTITNSIIDNNEAVQRGGGLEIEAGSLSITNSTISNNQAVQRGGGLEIEAGSLSITNSTISNNYAGQQGAGIYISGGTASINNSTIHQNFVTNLGVAAIGGGVANPNDRPFTVKNTIIAGNGGEGIPDCLGAITSAGHNLIGFAAGCDITAAAGDLIGINAPVNALLGNLTDNGGSALTHALLAGSPAIDAGDPATCTLIDQRGTSRPQGGICDIGSFEGSAAGTSTPVIRTYTAANVKTFPGTLLCMNATPICTNGTNPHADAAHQYALGAYNLYRDKHDRYGVDNNNTPIVSTVHYDSNYDNAFWTGTQMVFGDASGYPLADDIVAHELTHGLMEYEANLFYFYQSGAINESISDLWGEYYDQTNGLGTDTPAVKWLHGEDLLPGGSGAHRSMNNPPQFGDPDKMTSSLYFKTDGDNGGVHYNSGVNNKAVYLMVDGDTFNGFTVTGIGWDKTAAIYYEAVTNLLFTGADYSDLYYVVQQACTTLSLTNFKGITAQDCQQVQSALDAVEMNSQPAPDFNPEALACPVGTFSNSTLTLFEDDFENGYSQWNTTNYWSLEDFYAGDPTHMMWGDDTEEETKSTLDIKNGIVIPTGITYLYFKHAFAFEFDGNGNYDGGVLEYSINNGSTWVDAGSLYVGGKNYSGTIKSYNSSNPLKGRMAFTQDSHGYVSSQYNLATLAGNTVRFRWSMGTDQTYSYLGWFVDDVSIYRCTGTPMTPENVYPVNNGLITDYTPTISWATLPYDGYFHFQLDTDNSFTSPLYDVDNILGTTYTIPTNLAPDLTYYWRVRSYNWLSETTDWSTSTSFRTAVLPPVLTIPGSGTTVPFNRPVFDWDDVLNATSYTLQVSSTSNFTPFFVNTIVSESVYSLTFDLPVNQVVYWRVFTNAINGPSSASTASFTTANPASVPTLALPANLALVTTYTPKLDWNNSTFPTGTGFDHYHLQVASDTGFNNILEEHNNINGITNSVFTLGTPLPANSTIYWRVRSYNTAGQYSNWSAPRSFRTLLQAPSTLTLVPVPPVLNNRPTFDWNDVPGATSYTIQVSPSSTFAGTPTLNTTAAGSTYTAIKDLPANKTQYWRVSSNGTNGPSAWSTASIFTTANPPSTPALAAPAENGLIVNTLMPKLDWGNSTVPATVLFDHYEVQVATDTGFTTNVETHDVAGVGNSEYTLTTPLSVNTKYYWHVRSYNAAGQYSSWSVTRSFRIAMLPPSGLALIPPLSSVLNNRPVFDWDDVPGATSYTIQISTVNTFASFALHTTATGSTYTAIKDLPANKTLYWRVGSNGANGPSAWSTTSTFITANPPSIPALVAPAENLLITTTLMPKLDWNNSTVPVSTTFDHYEVQVATDSGFTANLESHTTAVGNIANSEFTFSAPLSVDTKYYWRVRSYNGDGQYSSWSLTRSFRVAMLPPALTSPTNLVALATNRPVFDWADVPGATSYTIQVSPANTFAGTLTLNTMAAGSTYIPVKDLPANKILYWRVRTNGANGPSNWTSPFSFTTANPPSVPALVAPTEHLLILATLTPRLDWGNSTFPAGTTFDHYEVEIATDSTFTTNVESHTTIVGDIASSEFTFSTPLTTNTKYYWRVRSYNGVGQYSSWSLIHSFRIAMLPPAALLSPANTTSPAIDTNRPVFDWDDAVEATNYTIQVSPVNTFAGTLTLNTTAIGSTYLPVKDLPANKTLFWRVRSNGLNGPSAWSTTSTFNTANPPSVPALVVPTESLLILATLTPRLDWGNSTFPAGTTFDHYEVQIATDAAFTANLESHTTTAGNIANSEFTFGVPLTPNTKYYWRVRSHNSTGQNSSWSLTRSFRIAMLPPSSLSISPGATLPRPVFDWEDMTGATGYTIQVSSSPTFSSLLVNKPATTSTYTPTVNLPLNTTLYWRVRTNGANGPGNWSSTATFTLP